jgi:DNA-binding transcriptional LysR family regulator
MKIDDLLLLAEVLQAGSLAATARALAVPKATLSRRLSALEAAVGQRLFVPGARRLALTPFGQELAERALRHREDIEDTRQWIGSQETRPRGLLRLSVPADFAILLLAEPMARFVQRYPEVQLDVDVSPRRVDLRSEPFDIAIRIGPLDAATDGALMARPLMQLSRGLYASPLYLGTERPPRTPAELEAHRWVLLAQGRGFSLRLMRGRKVAELRPRGPMQVNSIGLARAAVLAGAGLGSFPHGMVRADVAAGTLLPVLPGWQFDPLPVTLLTASRKLMPAKVRAFIDHLTETAAGWAL